MSASLQYLNVTTLRNEDCRGYLNEKWAAYVLENVLCVDNTEGFGVCYGDTGAGLVNIADGKVIAVSSWNFGCATGRPDGFTRVGPYLTWITGKTGIKFD